MLVANASPEIGSIVAGTGVTRRQVWMKELFKLLDLDSTAAYMRFPRRNSAQLQPTHGVLSLLQVI